LRAVPVRKLAPLFVDEETRQYIVRYFLSTVARRSGNRTLTTPVLDAAHDN